VVKDGQPSKTGVMSSRKVSSVLSTGGVVLKMGVVVMLIVLEAFVVLKLLGAVSSPQSTPVVRKYIVKLHNTV